MLVRSLICLLPVLSFTVPTFARDYGQYNHIAPQVRDWVKGLKDRGGVGCCDTADGFPPEAVWDIGGGRYRVMIGGKWYDVPEAALILEPNRLGYAVVWYISINGEIQIRCFIPGPVV